MWNKLKKICAVAGSLTSRTGRKFASHISTVQRGYQYGERWETGEHADVPTSAAGPSASGELERYFDAHREGPGIWKWRHYFDIYERHFSKFRGQAVNLCEIGIFSGGSLQMWKDYFGPQTHIYGVDIEQACEKYADESVTVMIGDQADREFWKTVRRNVPQFDIVIDDGGHHPEQQIITLEEVLPHLRPGGVYLCEDVHGEFNTYAAYVCGLSRSLNAANRVTPPAEAANGHCCETTPFQRNIGSIHLYPFVTVIEKNETELEQLIAPRHGTEWQPFL